MADDNKIDGGVIDNVNVYMYYIHINDEAQLHGINNLPVTVIVHACETSPLSSFPVGGVY